jgi:hypothetical protein
VFSQNGHLAVKRKTIGKRMRAKLLEINSSSVLARTNRWRKPVNGSSRRYKAFLLLSVSG